jgi:hypothetical protein
MKEVTLVAEINNKNTSHIWPTLFFSYTVYMYVWSVKIRVPLNRSETKSMRKAVSQIYWHTCSTTTRMVPRNKTHVACSSCAWFIFNLNTKSCYSQIVYITVFTHQMRFLPAQPLVPCCLLFYLLGEPAFLLMVRIPIHSCPWSVITCPPFATSPTLPHPIDQVTIFT